ncbi:MAG: sulfatase-like hydrolase/transferase, partial [Nitrospinaceae bacterium]|nr:sulfatase-like hydrolase/transferase [Nitrospinaceae bacterium]
PDRQDPFTTDSDGRPFDKPLDIALGFISKFSDKPFFLNFAPFYVHGPIQTRDRARMELYCKKMGYDFPSDPGAINQGKAGHSNPYYASMVDTVDWMIGQVVNLLEATDDPRNPGHKLIENTYVIIDSDNGGWIGSSAEPITDNSPLYGGKMTTFEGGIRIPFIVRGPGVEPGSVCRTPINLIDLFPTFMHMAGLVPAKELQLDGCNILPLIQGKSETARLADGSIRESIFWYYPIESHMSAVVRKGDWKLLRNYGIGMQTREGVQLFRLVNEDGSPADPGEKTDLSEKYPEIRDALLAELDAHLADAGAAMPTRNLNSASDAEKAASPGVLKTGSQRDTAWA